MASSHPASTYQILTTLSQDLPLYDSLGSPALPSGPWISKLPLLFLKSSSYGRKMSCGVSYWSTIGEETYH